MLDIKALEQEVQDELAAERAEVARTRLKAKLEQISKAERVLQNLRLEYKDLIADIALDA